MSGVFAVVDPGCALGALQRLADTMASAMSHRDWFVADRVVDDARRMILGRIGIGIFNQAPQPVWNARRTAAVVMAGEVSGPAPPTTACGAHGRVAGEQLVLALYEEFAEAFVLRLTGAFIIGLWDVERHRLLIANDRFGLYPLFYSRRTGTFVCAPEMKGVLCNDAVPRTLDLTALAQYMRFQQLLGERTFFEDISLLPNASLLICDLDTAACTIAPYWTFDQIPYRPRITFAEAVEETGRLLRRSVQRLSNDRYRVGVYLSGGLDSRSILGLIDRRPVVSLTYGRHDCRDVYYARRVARAVGSDHCWLDLPDGRWVQEQADFHLELTEGLHSWIHAHGMTTLSEARRLMDVNLTGWDGGTVMGHQDSVEPRQVAAIDDIALLTRLFHLFNQRFTWPSLTEAEEVLLYSEHLRPGLRGRAFDSLREELARYLHQRPDVRGEYFYIRNHCGRATHNLVTFTRSHVEVRFPFFDYELIEFIYSLPAMLRGHRTLYRAVIQREMPRLAYIPYERDQLLPTTRSWIRGAHALAGRLGRAINRQFGSVVAERPTLYADYEGYLRHELRAWAHAILFDRRTMDRGFFDPTFLRSLMARHLSGHEQWTIGKIAPVITYEMMLRRFCD